MATSSLSMHYLLQLIAREPRASTSNPGNILTIEAELACFERRVVPDRPFSFVSQFFNSLPIHLREMKKFTPFRKQLHKFRVNAEPYTIDEFFSFCRINPWDCEFSFLFYFLSILDVSQFHCMSIVLYLCCSDDFW